MGSPLRRGDRAVTDEEGLRYILATCTVCRIAAQDEEGLYIVPVNYGYRYENGGLTLFFHSAKEGRKVRAFAQNPEVAFEMDCEYQLVPGKTACKYGAAYKSIIGNGTVRRIDDVDARKEALMALMRHQTGEEFTFTDRMTETVAVYALTAQRFSGKQRLYP